MNAPSAVTKWISLIEKCRHPEISPTLILALIWQESAGDRWAQRYEANYQYFYDHKRKMPLYDKVQSVSGNRVRATAILGVTEFHSQSQSWGLLQLMGAAARERRFNAPYLAELTDPEANIGYGTLHLWEWGYGQGKYTTAEALKRWNGGDDYADKVLTKLAAIEGD